MAGMGRRFVGRYSTPPLQLSQHIVGLGKDEMWCNQGLGLVEQFARPYPVRAGIDQHRDKQRCIHDETAHFRSESRSSSISLAGICLGSLAFVDLAAANH